MIAALLVITGMAIVFGLLLGYAAIRFKVEGNPVAEKIDAILPQTQCGQCGFVGCRPYAEAITAGEAEINLNFSLHRICMRYFNSACFNTDCTTALDTSPV